ncbi:MAG TPA: hypothetical protein VFI51_00030 [Bradyrhizobium sp.]|nr:hypothetical protein [Bradyrhizobium sp.]
MKLAVIALSTASIIAFAPVVFAQGVSSKTPSHQMQKYGKKAGHRASSYAPGHQMQADRSKTGYPGAYGYAPADFLDRETEISRKAGGGGGGGSGM